MLIWQYEDLRLYSYVIYLTFFKLLVYYCKVVMCSHGYYVVYCDSISMLTVQVAPGSL